MKAVANLFIARSRAAVFWFLVTCATPILTGWYVQSVIANVRTLPQFVMGGLPSFQYLVPGVKPDTVQQLHDDQTRLAMETIYNRGPSGLDHQNRRFKLFTDEVNDLINTAIIAPNVLSFRDTKAYQKVEIEKIVVNGKEGQGEATTVAYARLFRTGVEDGITINKEFTVKVFFTWKSNPNPVDHAMYPTVCSEVTFFSTIQTFP